MANVARLTASLKAQKGHFTCARKELKAIADYVLAEPSSKAVAQLEKALDTFQAQAAKVENLYRTLLDEDPDVDNHDQYVARLDELSDTKQEGLEFTLHAITEASRTAAPHPAAAPAQPQVNFRPKVVDALRPNKLTMDNTPAELRNWLSKFKAYYTTSGLDQYTIAEQQVFLFNNVSSDLETRIKENDGYAIDLRVFGDIDSLTAILIEEFNHKYPLFNRRLDFFRYQQASGQSFSDFMIKLRKQVMKLIFTGYM